LILLAIFSLVGFLLRARGIDVVRDKSTISKPSDHIEAEHLLAMNRCLPTTLLKNKQTFSLLPVVTKNLISSLHKKASSTDFEELSTLELRELLESIHGIGPKKANILLPLFCHDSES
jgi:endonuclease III-like uncharacterized protein